MAMRLFTITAPTIAGDVTNVRVALFDSAGTTLLAATNTGVTTTLSGYTLAVDYQDSWAAHGVARWYYPAGTEVGMAEYDVRTELDTPAETAGRPSKLNAMLRRLWEGKHNKRTRNRSSGATAIRNAADSGDLETATQASVGSVDSQSKGV